MNAAHPLVKKHIQAGAQAFVLEQGMNGHMITIYDGDHHIPMLWTHLIPATVEGKAMHNVQNAMFAAALAYNMGVNLDNIRQGLRTFDTSFFQAPGRMNIYDEHNFKVILDYAHNPAAVKAICGLVELLETEGRKIAVLAAPGDRRDEDIEAIAKIAAPYFDHFVCRRDDSLRGRQGDEVPMMLKRTLIDAGVDPSCIEIVNDEQQANNHALGIARAGDLLLILGDDIQRTWKQIIYFDSEQQDATPTVSKVTRPELPDELGFSLDDNIELIQDERGVRLARDAGD